MTTHPHRKHTAILRLPDLEQSKSAVLHSHGATSSQESYRHAIDEFIGWYCSEPRLAFNRTVVLRYRFFLEQKNLAPSTINVRLAAVRRLAYEASDTGFGLSLAGNQIPLPHAVALFALHRLHKEILRDGDVELSVTDFVQKCQDQQMSKSVSEIWAAHRQAFPDTLDSDKVQLFRWSFDRLHAD